MQAVSVKKLGESLWLVDMGKVQTGWFEMQMPILPAGHEAVSYTHLDVYKRQDGAWVEWPENARLKEWYGCIEANSYQQGWFVPHDVPGMVNLMGGKEKVIADLTDFFDKTPSNMLWNEYYNHANEPVHFVPFLFGKFVLLNRKAYFNACIIIENPHAVKDLTDFNF